MIPDVPATVRQALGEDVARDLAGWMNLVIEDRGMAAGLSSRFDDVESSVSGLRTDVDGLRTDVNVLQSEVRELRTDVDGLRTDVNVLQTDVRELRTDVDGLRTDVNVLQSEVRELRTDVDGLRTDMNVLQTDVRELRNDLAVTRDGLHERLDGLALQWHERLDRHTDRIEARIASQTRWTVSLVGLVASMVTFLLAIERLGLTVP